MLQRIATHCNALQHTTTHCSTLQPCHLGHCEHHLRLMLHIVMRCNALQHTATHCNTLQHTATHCNTLQHTATHCNTLQHTATFSSRASRASLEACAAVLKSANQLHAHIHICVCVCVCVCTCAWESMHTYTYMCVCVCERERECVYAYSCAEVPKLIICSMGLLHLVGSLKSKVSFAEYHLFNRALLQRRPIISRSLLIVATPYPIFYVSYIINTLHHIYYSYLLFFPPLPRRSHSTYILCYMYIRWIHECVRVCVCVCACQRAREGGCVAVLKSPNWLHDSYDHTCVISHTHMYV